MGNGNLTSVAGLKKEFETEIDTIEAKAFAKGQASATGTTPEIATAERLAAKARELQAANPKLSNLEATRAAYEAEGVPMK